MPGNVERPVGADASRRGGMPEGAMIMAEPEFVLGYDFGTGSVKAALFDRQGNVVAEGRQPYPLLTPASGWAEQRPEDWWRAMSSATSELMQQSGVSAGQIGALGIAAQMAGAVPVDREGAVLNNALTWLDTRSEAIASRIVSGPVRFHGYGVEALARWLWLTNGVPNREGRDPTSKYLWFREECADLWPRLHKLLDVKDYLVYRATGEFVTTADCAHLTWLMDSRRGRNCWSPSLLRRLDLDPAYLPKILPSTSKAGELSEAAADALRLRAGTLVAAGAGDVGAFSLGTGRLESGALHLHVGTSSWWACHRERRKVDIGTGIATIAAADPGRYLLVAAQESAGACVEWAARALGFGQNGKIDLPSFDRAAGEAAPEPDQPIFLPWLQGERVPVDDRHLRGGFMGLSLGDDRAGLARAVLEGVALNIRWALQAIERVNGSTASSIRFLGGGARSRIWTGILADVLQRPLEVVAAPHLGGARGAAMTAAVAAGWFGSLEAAQAMSRIERTVAPETRLTAHYGSRFARFLEHLKRARERR